MAWHRSARGHPGSDELSARGAGRSDRPHPRTQKWSSGGRNHLDHHQPDGRAGRSGTPLGIGAPILVHRKWHPLPTGCQCRRRPLSRPPSCRRHRPGPSPSRSPRRSARLDTSPTTRPRSHLSNFPRQNEPPYRGRHPLDHMSSLTLEQPWSRRAEASIALTSEGKTGGYAQGTPRYGTSA